MTAKGKMAEVNRRLGATFGDPPTDRRDPLETLIRTILSQNTSDRNRDRAYAELRTRFPTWEEVLNAAEEDVAQAIRPAGVYRERAKRIQEVLRRIRAERGNLSLDFLSKLSNEEAEGWLLSLPGVGKKTAYVVLLFAFGREKFPVDTHIRRVAQRLCLWNGRGDPHSALAEIVPKGRAYALHLNLIRLGREICRPQNPRCANCPLFSLCPHGQNVKKEEK